jgi:hypothetical protein
MTANPTVQFMNLLRNLFVVLYTYIIPSLRFPKLLSRALQSHT